MKILIFSHSATPGGAENALRALVDKLRKRHQVHVVLPFGKGVEAEYYSTIGVVYFELAMPLSLPAVQNTLLAYVRAEWNRVCEVLASERYDIAISNTLAILHGQMISKKLNIPHVTYVHEYLDDPELCPEGISRESYLKLIESGSSGIIGCSHFVMDQFEGSENPKLVLPPFDYAVAHPIRKADRSGEKVLQVIGTQSYRKNIPFAVTVAKSLAVLGVTARLDVIGGRNKASEKIKRALEKSGVSFRVIAHHSDPYSINIGSDVVTLVCSTTEPYGLTIPESLRLGIPVLASRSGGPEEILPADYLFTVDDCDRCVRTLMSVWNDYESACKNAFGIYKQLQISYAAKNIEIKIEEFLEKAINLPLQKNRLTDLLLVVEKSAKPPISISDITGAISAVSSGAGRPIPVSSVERAIDRERKEPGSAVLADIKEFGVVPFAMSEAMDNLYRRGFGLAIELAAYHDHPVRIQMATYIACRLWQAQQDLQRPVTVLALGDGIGIDSIRLANAGFDMYYMDYDGSNMARIAGENFKTCLTNNGNFKAPSLVDRVSKQYDAVVCLEVIEHVSDVNAFIQFIAGCVGVDGLVFMSECFNGVESKWPTHLHNNEKYAGQLPFLMSQDFDLESVNSEPYAKPYVFKRRDRDRAGTVNLLNRRDVATALFRNQLDIGI